MHLNFINSKKSIFSFDEMRMFKSDCACAQSDFSMRILHFRKKDFLMTFVRLFRTCVCRRYYTMLIKQYNVSISVPAYWMLSENTLIKIVLKIFSPPIWFMSIRINNALCGKFLYHLKLCLLVHFAIFSHSETVFQPINEIKWYAYMYFKWYTNSIALCYVWSKWKY